MVLIQSIKGERSTDAVVRWLLHMGHKVLRLNDVAQVESVEYRQGGFFIKLAGVPNELDLGGVQAYWYRRGAFKTQVRQMLLGEEVFDDKYGHYLGQEHQASLDYLLHHLKYRVNCIGDSASCIDINKNIVLEEARQLGLLVPDILITGQKEHVKPFLEKHGSLITKPVHGSFTYGNDEYWYPTYTETIDADTLDQLPERFQPTLFQQNVIKKLEVRTFYLKGQCHSMAIFSQNDAQTATDFRKYNDARPNRNVPFALPEAVASRLHALMEKLGLESGSADFIYTPEKTFYFLEVNPVGQFGMTSLPCNYPLEKQIAETLCPAPKN